MTDDVTRLWAHLKAALERSMGVEGSAHWLAFAAQQQALKANKLAQRNVVELNRSEWTP